MGGDYRVAAQRFEERRTKRNERRQLQHRVFDLEMELIAARRAILDYDLDHEEQSEREQLVRLSLDEPSEQK